MPTLKPSHRERPRTIPTINSQYGCVQAFREMSAASQKKMPTALKDVDGVPEFSDNATLETKRRMPYPSV